MTSIIFKGLTAFVALKLQYSLHCICLKERGEAQMKKVASVHVSCRFCPIHHKFNLNSLKTLGFQYGKPYQLG